ncbi:MAG: hypothetical protein CTY12_01300 [Methylotenera sp.]|nr:MAG: hypothetical protein CTY12_01300 [Methylotenera sp.]
MSLANFFKNYGKAKTEQIGEGIVNFAAQVDADGVSEAAVKQKQDEHAELVKALVEAQNDFKREKAEFDEIFALYTKKVAAAERAQADLEKDPNNTGAATALTELLEGVEKIAPKLEKEKTDFIRAEQYMKEMQEAADAVAKELLGLREQINNVKQESKEADLELQRNKKQLEQAERLAGLRTASNKFDVALGALQKQSQAKQNEAEAARIAAEQLRKPVETVSSAAAAYLDSVSEPVVTESLQDKLARLKNVAK